MKPRATGLVLAAMTAAGCRSHDVGLVLVLHDLAPAPKTT